jgi:Ca2+-binding RTX toxin-like protein
MPIGTTTNGNDRIAGTGQNERLEGANGNDTLVGGGGADTLVGDGGNDRLIADNASGITGLRGGPGDDYLYATIEGSGQVHMFGGDGDDTLVMDLTKDPDRFSDGEQVRYTGQHAYGGGDRDTFAFVNESEASGVIIGRIDDFNASEDTLLLDDEVLDMRNLPDDVHLFAFKDQQWIRIGENAYFALEGAREGGAERHFLNASDLQAMLRASQDPDASVKFVDQMNEVPVDLVLQSIDFDATHSIGGSENEADFIGSAGNDAVYDTRVRSASIPEDVTDSRFEGRDGDDLINAGKGHDTVSGGGGSDSLAGGLDDDLLMGGTGNDLLFGGSEHDTLLGNTGNDMLEGGSGEDWLDGGQGNDVMRGQSGSDILFGGAGNDRMSGGDNEDQLSGDSGHDRIYGLEGNDFLRGGSGRDTLLGGTGSDKLNGGGWSDRLQGQRGDDTLTGGQGNDTLFGGRGDDWLSGGKNQDLTWGGRGKDIFAYSDEDLLNWADLSGDVDMRARQLDRIEDFKIGEDKILLSGFANTADINDLNATTLAIDGKSYGMLSIEETNQRILVQLEKEEALEELMEEDNFVFF